MAEPMRSESNRGLRARRRGEPVAALLAYVPPELRTAARVHAAQSGTTISALVTSALTDRLKGQR